MASSAPISIPTTPSVLLSDEHAAAAYARMLPAIDAVSDAETVRVPVDPATVARIVVGAAPGIRSHRGRIASELPQFPIRVIDELEDTAFAAWHAHVLATPTVQPDGRLSVLVAQGAPLRERMMSSAQADAAHGHFPQKKVEALRGGTGHQDLANDLEGLGAMYAEQAESLRGRTQVTAEDVAQARTLAKEIMKALAARTQATAEPGSLLATRRAKALTLLVRAHAECRRAIEYIRFAEGDAEDIVPSLFPKRGRRAPTPEAEAQAPEAPSQPVTDAAPASDGGAE